MKNNQNNWTVGTTWWKWFFTDGQKMTIIGASILIHIFILCFNIHEFLDMPLWGIILTTTLLNIGVTLILITSVIDWRKEKKKLDD